MGFDTSIPHHEHCMFSESLGLYVHLPFCRVHCTYCAFAISTDLRLEEAYTGALLREIEARASSRSVDTVYFGGGTPSRTSIGSLRRVVDQLRAAFPTWSPREFTLEANPEDVTAESLAAWRSLGVDRLSIGVQSLHESELRPLGRVHGPVGALQAIAIATSSGVRTSLDLILGLPGQTSASFEKTLRRATSAGVGHISLYLLDLEEGSTLARHVGSGRTRLPEDDAVATAYVDAVALLAAHGFHQYEISNFARPGEESIHNLRYWYRERYLGFGLGAHSFDNGRRYANTRDIKRYIETSPAATDFEETLSEAETQRERIFLGLRQARGLHYGDIEAAGGQEGKAWIARGLAEGWLRREDDRIAFTPSGFLLSTELISQLF